MAHERLVNILNQLTPNTLSNEAMEVLSSLRLETFSDNTLRVVEQLCCCSGYLDKVHKIANIRNIAFFIEGSRDNTALVEHLLEHNDFKKINSLGFLLQTLPKNISIAEREEYITFFLNHSQNWLRFHLANAMDMHMPIHLLEELVRRNLLDKFFGFECIKFWDAQEFPWTNDRFIVCLQRATNSQSLYFLLFTDLPLEKIQIDESCERQMLHSIDNPEFITSSRFGDQKLFNLQTEAAIQEAVPHIKDGSWGFDHLLCFFAYRRHQIAVEAKSIVDNYYGKLSIMTFETWCKHGYKALGERLETLHQTTNSRNYKINSQNEGEYYFHGIHVGTLTTKLYTKVFCPSHPDNLPALLPYMKRAFKNAQKASNPDALMDSLGEFFWVFCMSKTCCRGNESIANMFIKSIFCAQYNQTKTFKWKNGLIPWCEVVSEPDVDKFVKNFRNLIEIIDL